MAFLKCVVSFFFLHSDTASLERFRTRIPSELCSENLYKFTNALKEYCGMKEACAKHCISDFELKMFGISKQSKESYALYTQLQWTTEREAILSDLEGNELNGQNKNQFVIAYLARRVFQNLHEETVLMMQIPGHTRCLIDSGFAHIKKLFRRSNVDALSQLSVLVEKSAYSNTAITYHDAENDEENWTWYDWKTFLKEHFLPMKGIRKYHHFRVTKDDLSVVYVKTGSEREETRIKILRRGVQIPRDVYPTSVPAAGLSRERAKYLFQTVRPLVRTAFQVATCPRPSEE